MDNDFKLRELDRKSILKFLIPSLIGVFIFLFPLPYKEEINVPIGIFSEWLANFVSPIASILVTLVILISAIMSIIAKTLKPKVILDNKLLSKLFVTGNIYLIFRIIGAIGKLHHFHQHLLLQLFQQKPPLFLIHLLYLQH